MYSQPPNSPDLNVLDLGFFNSLQSIVAKEGTRNKQFLIEMVKEKFDNYPYSKINHVFLSLQMAMQEIILCNGGNDYGLTHMSKTQLGRNGNLPMSIALPVECWMRWRQLTMELVELMMVLALAVVTMSSNHGKIEKVMRALYAYI